METRILPSSPDVSFSTSTARVTPSPPSAVKFGDVLASTTVKAAESAANVLPGGPMIALALRNSTAAIPLGTPTSALAAGALPAGATTTADPTGITSGTTSTPGTSPADIQSSLQQSADQNMMMIQVQQQVQQQSQQFTTISNMLKAQYDTVKNAIGNIR